MGCSGLISSVFLPFMYSADLLSPSVCSQYLQGSPVDIRVQTTATVQAIQQVLQIMMTGGENDEMHTAK